MTNEKRFLGYLDSLKGSTNQKLIECVQNGFKTLVEYQVVGNMSERGVDLMEGNEPSAIPDSIRSLVEKLTAEIEELRDAMVDINEITEPLVPEEVAEEVAEVEEEREELEEASVSTPDGVEVNVSAGGQSAANSEAAVAAQSVESGGSVSEKEPQQIPDVDPRDIDGIETGQRLGKVEGCRTAVNEFGGAVVGIVGKLAAQYLAGASLDKIIDIVAGDADATEKAEMSKEVEDAAEKMRVAQTEGYESYESYESEDMPKNIRRGEAAGNDAGDSNKDHEGKMANKQLDQIADQSERLSGSFDDKEELKAWVQAKITKAQQTIDTLYEYFREEKGLDEKVDDMDSPAGEEEQPIFEK